MEATQAPKFFGRRKGRTIRKAKTFLLDSFLPQFLIDSTTDITKKNLFPQPFSKYYLEIGFGDGAHLAGLSLQKQDVGFVGVEVFQNGVANLLSLISGVKDTSSIKQNLSVLKNRADNVRIFDDDVRLLFRHIPDHFFDKIYLLFPDPWPKNRHKNRRFINQSNLDEIFRILKKGGILQIATDHPVYKRHVLRTMHSDSRFEWTAKKSADWRNPPSDWVPTKYQNKAIKEGRRPVFFEYKRL